MASLPANVPFSCQDWSHPTPSHVLPLKWRQEQLRPGHKGPGLSTVSRETASCPAASCPAASCPASPPAALCSSSTCEPRPR